MAEIVKVENFNGLDIYVTKNKAAAMGILPGEVKDKDSVVEETTLPAEPVKHVNKLNLGKEESDQ